MTKTGTDHRAALLSASAAHHAGVPKWVVLVSTTGASTWMTTTAAIASTRTRSSQTVSGARAGTVVGRGAEEAAINPGRDPPARTRPDTPDRPPRPRPARRAR